MAGRDTDKKFLQNTQKNYFICSKNAQKKVNNKAYFKGEMT